MRRLVLPTPGRLRTQLADSWQDRRGRLSDWRGPAAGTPITSEAETPSPVAGPHQQLRQELFERLLRDVEDRGAGADDASGVRIRVRRVINEALEQGEIPELTIGERETLEDDLVSEATGYGPLAPLVADATVSDILVNGPTDVYIDRFGRLEKSNVRFDSLAHLSHVITRLVASHDRHIDGASPYVDVRLRDGSRLHAVVPPLTPVPVLCLRRSRSVPFTLEHLCAAGTLSREMADYLSRVVRQGANIVISGGVGSGKTTLLNVLAAFIPADTRVVTIEETAELRLPHPHVVTLESRLPNIEGRGEVTLRTLVRNALRMRADRLIVGEVRGPEVFDMLQAMNTGHAGSLTTVHANSAADALRRLESLVLMAGFPLPSSAIRDLLANTIHVVVHIRRFPDGMRRIVAVEEVETTGDGQVGTRPIFQFAGGQHTATGHAPQWAGDARDE